MINAVILDDEHHSIETLQWKLENYCPEVKIIQTFNEPIKAVEYLKNNPPDLLFLDIEMPMLNGFDVLEELGRQLTFDVIFTTAYDQFGIQAVKASALDYLLKPVQNKELKNAIDKYKIKASEEMRSNKIEGLLENVKSARNGGPTKIALATKESIEFVEKDDIIACTSDSNYTMVFLAGNRKKLISKTLKEFEELLVPMNFYRPHNSHLINLEKVQEFVRSDGGYLVMENGMKIPVSKNKREGLLGQLM
ncbi:MAG: LytTR family DNA-binding domain-containing protein [Saprospiraceae bacterium]